jgi:non-ribosomal peptide synthetase component F
VIVAGEALGITAQMAALFARLCHCRLVNQYGPSETHVVTAFEATGDPQDWPPLPPIGRPIENVRVLILDEAQRPVPSGFAGEIQSAAPPSPAAI